MPLGRVTLHACLSHGLCCSRAVGSEGLGGPWAARRTCPLVPPHAPLAYRRLQSSPAALPPSPFPCCHPASTATPSACRASPSTSGWALQTITRRLPAHAACPTAQRRLARLRSSRPLLTRCHPRPSPAPCPRYAGHVGRRVWRRRKVCLLPKHVRGRQQLQWQTSPACGKQGARPRRLPCNPSSPPLLARPLTRRRGGRVQMLALPMPDTDYFNAEKGAWSHVRVRKFELGWPAVRSLHCS